MYLKAETPVSCNVPGPESKSRKECEEDPNVDAAGKMLLYVVEILQKQFRGDRRLQLFGKTLLSSCHVVLEMHINIVGL